MLFLVYNHIPGPSCHGAANCIAKCFKELDYVINRMRLFRFKSQLRKKHYVISSHSSSLGGQSYLVPVTGERCQARDHLDFICRMKDYISRQEFINRTISALGSQFFVTSLELESFDCPDDTKFVPSSRLLGKQELKESLESESRNVILQSL
ncbi:hypothetical protein RND71_006277 [Anisodus tanguticus]|uniref:Uncharacterized protein n=1 Tax=Anisodus tanguticus TaxID=243964 RepID=A0AAE1ST18_9SOLA|nr:hypothetical protein RND71_006277 [Anisodus tanguticus]